MPHKLIYLVSFALLVFGCSQDKKLPYLGKHETRVVDGKTDTLYHQVPPFKFLNQDSVWVSEKDMAGKIYIADFFFTTCPTICPKMKTQLVRLYERYADNDQIRILSHTIDPEFDRPHVLKQYANRLQVQAPRWNMVTGDKQAIYTLGEKSYLVTAQEDKNEVGGFVHSGAFILVDKQRHIRGIYDGTKEEEVNHLIEDLEILLKTN
ncbi:SCO family protein [Aquirufa sp. OSTEICH-129V]|uniref:SCO family protein n=1 Tax=Aquirufa avitistagni TaxID=3104728 RepID=A0ABW6D8C5_9BACT